MMPNDRPTTFTPDQLAEAVPDGLSKIDGIVRTNTVLAFRRFSSKDLQAAWDLGLS